MYRTEKLNRLLLIILFSLTSLAASDVKFRGLSADEISSRPIPASFGSLIESAYGIPRHELNLERGTFMIITNENLVAYLGDLVEFKRSQGFHTVVKTQSEFGTTADAIKTSIVNYMETDPMLEYVLLLGDVDGGFATPTFYYSIENDASDQKYTHVTGDDFIPDFFIGRFSVDSIVELFGMVNKTINYSRNPLAGNDGWLDNALVVAGNYSNTTPVPITPVWTSKWIRSQLLEYGYQAADTVFYPPVQQGAAMIQAAFNSGVGLVNYRGWGDANGWHYPEFHVNDVSALNNGTMTPVVASFVCNSADFANNVDPCLGEALTRAGTIAVPKGAVAMVGPSDLHTSTKFNNVINSYMLDAMLDEGVLELGPAMLAGQMGLFTEFPHLDGPGEGQEFYFHVYNILGDPSLPIHLLTPDQFTISYQPVSTQDGIVDILVRNSSGSPVSAAVVALLVDGELVGRGVTGSDGRYIGQLADITSGTIDIYVNKTGFVQAHSEVAAAGPDRDVTISGFLLKDAAGNDLAAAAPGHIVHVYPQLSNSGTSSYSSSLSAEPGLGLQPIDISAASGSVSSGQTAASSEPFIFRVREFAGQGQFLVDVIDESGSLGRVLIPVIRPVLEIYVAGENILPGASFNGSLEVVSHSAAAWDNLTVNLVTMTDSLSFPDPASASFSLAAWGSASELNAFSGTVGNVSFGSGLDVSISLYQDSILVYNTSQSLPVQPATVNDPVPPSPYGYWAYDNGDTGYDQAPVFDWVELNSNGSAALTLLDDDDHFNLDLPFDFQYFGETYDQVTINSNGWISFLPCNIDYFWNFSIPMALGPDGQVAPFWDDLEVIGTDSIRVYTWHDAANGRFIIEWDGALNGYDEVTEETFEIILYDQDTKPTASGDGVIDFQYHSVADVDITKNYSTVGIESGDQNEGIQYLFNNAYAPGAATLANGLAIRFTTESPTNFVPSLSIEQAGLPEEFSLLPAYPNPFNPTTRISFRIAEDRYMDVAVYDLMGRLVSQLVQQKFNAGSHSLVWNGLNGSGRPVSSGTYFVVAKSAGERRSSKLLLLK